MTKSLALIGFASGIAANNPDCALGPWYMYYHPELFHAVGMNVDWQGMVQTSSDLRGRLALPLVESNIEELAHAVVPFARNSQPFCVIGGDHSCAIGTWSAVAHANKTKGDIGLVWIDAHMDSHTPDTSTSQNLHGMPVAHLLGEGVKRLCEVLDKDPKLKPKNLCLIGIRSYEPGEMALLERLGVTVYMMDEVHERGIQTVLTEACHALSNTTCGLGITIDMDSIDPIDAPGVGCPEPHGIKGAELVAALQSVCHDRPLLGLEIAEFNPLLDQNGLTAKLLVDLIHAVYPPIP